MTLTGT